MPACCTAADTLQSALQYLSRISHQCKPPVHLTGLLLAADNATAKLLLLQTPFPWRPVRLTAHWLGLHECSRRKWNISCTAVNAIVYWLVSVAVRTLNLRSRGDGFDSRSSRYQVVSTWMNDRLRAGKPSRYVTSRIGQLSLPSFRGR